MSLRDVPVVLSREVGLPPTDGNFVLDYGMRKEGEDERQASIPAAVHVRREGGANSEHDEVLEDEEFYDHHVRDEEVEPQPSSAAKHHTSDEPRLLASQQPLSSSLQAPPSFDQSHLTSRTTYLTAQPHLHTQPHLQTRPYPPTQPHLPAQPRPPVQPHLPAQPHLQTQPHLLAQPHPMKAHLSVQPLYSEQQPLMMATSTPATNLAITSSSSSSSALQPGNPQDASILSQLAPPPALHAPLPTRHTHAPPTSHIPPPTDHTPPVSEPAGESGYSLEQLQVLNAAKSRQISELKRQLDTQKKDSESHVAVLREEVVSDCCGCGLLRQGIADRTLQGLELGRG